MNFKGTKGDWKSTSGTFDIDLIMVSSTNGVVCDIRKSLLINEQLANAQLIEDAGNTINKCDLLPSELLEQRNVLFEALIKIRKSIKNQKLESNFGHTLSYVDEAIENIQNNKNG